MAANVLYYGDNLDVMRRHVNDETVDLVYLDPPFNSDADYNVLFEEHGERSTAQVRAFTDSWTWDTTARLAYEETVRGRRQGRRRHEGHSARCSAATTCSRTWR